MKVEAKGLLLCAIFVALLFFGDVFSHKVDKAHLSTMVNPQTIANVEKGINLSSLERNWLPVDSLLADDIETKLTRIRNDGFKCVRLPVAFDHFLPAGSSNLPIALLDKLGSAYNHCEKIGLSMIISYHYGKVYYGSDNRYSERDRVMWMWKQVQNKFRGMAYDKLFFELYNEPTEERNAWKEDVSYLVHGLRWEENQRYYIIGGTNYNNADELLDLGKIDDEKLFYTFHFYEPFIFTHQGAEWLKERVGVTGIPYPYSKEKMPSLPSEHTGSALEFDFYKYPAEGTKDFIRLRLTKFVNECTKKGMPLICTETGTINKADEASRSRYLEDVTQILSQLNVPMTLWDYDQNFSVLSSDQTPLKPVKLWLEK